MYTDEIVPNILSEVPSSKITIIYPNGQQVDFGKELSPSDVQNEPEVKWECDSEKYYTLIMFDPDAPSKKYPLVSDVNHWLVGNIKGCDLSTGEVYAEYAGSAPPKRSGLHRYIFLVFEHNEKLAFDEPKLSKNTRLQRLRFSVKKFRMKYHFDKVFAWNYFKTQANSQADEPVQETRTCVCL